MNLSNSVEKLPYVGKVYARRLKRLDIKSVRDLLYHFPSRYQDFSRTKKISNLLDNDRAVVVGEVITTEVVRTKTRKSFTKVAIADKTGAIEAVWFSQPYLAHTLKKGGKIRLAGKVGSFGGRLAFISPEFELVKEGKAPIHTGGLTPVYPETSRVSSKWLRMRISNLMTRTNLLNDCHEFLPQEFLRRYGFPIWAKALQEIHFPKTTAGAERAKARFAFEELLLFNLQSLKRREAWKSRKLPVQLSYLKHKTALDQFVKELPFQLTQAQKRVAEEVLNDLEGKKPMNRLLQGDVGSGKTVVAAIASYLTYLCGAKTIIMAPTEILADQHFRTLKNLLEPKGVKIAAHTGAKKPGNYNKFDLWVGTHALFYRHADFEKVGLVVIDEQHRFGVEQRGKLMEKTRIEKTPHLLTLTATPIPRTLALTVYGDLDLSILDEMPPGRKGVKTFVVPKEKRAGGYRWIHRQAKAGGQIFVICPLIEESDKESMRQVKAASAEYEKLQEMFPDLKLGLLHGKLKSKEKEEVLEGFRTGKTNILVSTPVVEVGIDVPNATIMVIEAAERFGLASLHQLRGRVGRGEKESYCFLFTEEKAPSVTERLKALERISNGFDLADLDLRLRGPGEIYGTRQHGLAKLKVADLTDSKLLKISRGAAWEIINEDPSLTKNPLLAKELKRFSSSLIEPN